MRRSRPLGIGAPAQAYTGITCQRRGLKGLPSRPMALVVPVFVAVRQAVASLQPCGTRPEKKPLSKPLSRIGAVLPVIEGC